MIGLLATIAIAVASAAFADKSLQGFGTIMFIVPWGITALAGALILGFRLPPMARTSLAIVAAVIGFGFWDLVRNDGVWGDFRSMCSWRWSPTSEDLFLASLKSRAEADNGLELETESIEFTDRSAIVPRTGTRWCVARRGLGGRLGINCTERAVADQVRPRMVVFHGCRRSSLHERTAWRE